MSIPSTSRTSWLQDAAVFLIASAFAIATVAGPGLSWDEPAYRHSQVTVESWLAQLTRSGTVPATQLFSAPAIYNYFEFNRFGHNFHPPMASYGNLLTYGILGGFVDDIAARRIASCLLFAGIVVVGWRFVRQQAGTLAGTVTAGCLLFMPRLVGDAHVIGTDIPILFFWVIAGLLVLSSNRTWRWNLVFAWAMSCLFLVKFSGVMIAIPLLFALASSAWRERETLSDQVPRLVISILPAFVLTIIELFAWKRIVQTPTLVFYAILLSGPIIWLTLRKPWCTNQPAPLATDIVMSLGLLCPVLVVLLNPTWWHDPVSSLASYLDLNLNRERALPNIGIFYLGQRYFFSLPWHNGFVLPVITTPIGTVLLTVVGLAFACRRLFQDWTVAYLLTHLLTFPLLRIMHVPAHDGVRLMLPTLFMIGIFAGLGGAAIMLWANKSSRSMANVCAGLLLLLGPAWSAFEWSTIHPFELSYYNVGLPRAVDLGFEPTYWYDAVTTRELRRMNQELPSKIEERLKQTGKPTPTFSITFADNNTTAEVFQAQQMLGKLDPRLNISTRDPDVLWFWLLTHSSKANGMIKLLYMMEPVSRPGIKTFGCFRWSMIAVRHLPLPSTRSSSRLIRRTNRNHPNIPNPIRSSIRMWSIRIARRFVSLSSRQPNDCHCDQPWKAIRQIRWVSNWRKSWSNDGRVSR